MLRMGPMLPMCQRCNQELQAVSPKGVEVFSCPRYHGTLLSDGQRALVLEAMSAELLKAFNPGLTMKLTTAALLVLLVTPGCGGGGSGGDAAAGGAPGGADGRLDAAAGDDGAAGAAATPDGAAGADAAVEAAPFVCDAAPTTQLPFVFIREQSFTTDTTATYTVPKGFRVHGTVTLPALPANGKLSFGRMTATAEDGMLGAEVSVEGSAGNSFEYDLVVPAGRTTLVTYLQVDFTGADEGASISRTARESIEVCGDQLHDVALPALGPLHETALMLSGLKAFDPLIGVARQTTFSLQSADGSLSMGATADTDVGDVASERAMTPATTLQAWIDVEAAGKGPPESMREGGFRAFVRATDVPSAASVEAVLPALVKLSGTISDPNHRLQTGMQHAISCDGAGESSSADYSDDAPSYRTYVRKGPGCRLSNSFQTPLVTTFASNENHAGTITIPYPGELVVTSADLVRDFTVPATGPTVTIDVVVEDAVHTQISGARVRALSTAVAEPALANARFDTNFATTDDMAHAKLHVLPGTYRWVEIVLY